MTRRIAWPWEAVLAVTIALIVAASFAPELAWAQARPSGDANKKSVFESRTPIALACAESAGQEGDALKNCTYANRIWTKYQLASVVTGVDASGRWTGRRIVLAFVGASPYLLTKGRDEVEKKQREIADDIGKELRTTIDEDIVAAPDRLAIALKKGDTTLEQASMKASEDVAKEVASRLQVASIQYSSEMTTIFRKYGVNDTIFGLALVEVACLPSLNCSAGDYAFQEKSLAFQRYGKLRDWAHSQKATESRTVYRLRLGQGNVLVMQPDSEVRPLPGDGWPIDPIASRKLDEFERLVAKVRKTRNEHVEGARELSQINYAAPQSANIQKRSVLAVADVVDAPGYASVRLSSSGEAMKKTSDELARTRIRECFRLRGEFKTPGISDCAGYQVDEQVLVACMNGRLCIPATGQKMIADLLLIAAPSNVSSLVQMNAFPRLEIGTADEYMQLSKQCHTSARDNEVAFARCVTTAKYDKQKPLMDCIDTARGNAGRVNSTALEPCILKAASTAGLSASVQTGMRCALEHPDDPRSFAQCSATASLSPNARKALHCVETVHTSNGKPSPQALYGCVGGQNLELLKCASQKRPG